MPNLLCYQRRMSLVPQTDLWLNSSKRAYSMTLMQAYNSSLGSRIPFLICPLSAMSASSSRPAVLSAFPGSRESALIASATSHPLTSSPKIVYAPLRCGAGACTQVTRFHLWVGMQYGCHLTVSMMRDHDLCYVQQPMLRSSCCKAKQISQLRLAKPGC